MSARSKRTTTTTTTVRQTASTPESSPMRSPGRNRPPSPTMISRVQEKVELAGLNDRLATYIDRVRSLETENTKLSRQIQTHEETVHRETTNIKALYETELADARKLLDDTAKEKAKLQLDVNKYKSDFEDLKEKYGTQSRDLTSIQKRLLTAESQVNDLQARLNDALGQRKHWEDEYNKLKREYDALAKQLATAKKQLEDEMVGRVDLENRVQSLKEELSFKKQIHEQELNETISRTRVEIEEIDGKVQSEYEGKLAETLRSMREQNEEMIRLTREETEEVFEQKLATLRNLAEKNDDLAQRSQAEMATYRRRISDMSNELSKLRSQSAAQETRIRDLEAQLVQEQEDSKRALDMRDAEIRHLRSSLEEQMTEYRDLLEVKIQLDIEIAAYRKLLEVEETRLNISTASESTPSKGTPRRGTPMRSLKRKRATYESGETSGVGRSQLTESSASSGFSSTSSAKGSLEVYEVDPEGKYIKLFNSSEGKDQPVGGWVLKLTGGDEETVFKFHRSSIVKAGQYVTVWSADSGVTHQPPSDLVMKGQKWFTADAMKAVISNNKDEEMAARELKRSVLRTSYVTSSSSRSIDVTDSSAEDDRHSEGRDSNGRRSWFFWSK